MGSLFQAGLTLSYTCFLLLAGTCTRPQAAYCDPFSSRFYLAGIACMCSHLQQKYSLHFDRTLRYPWQGSRFTGVPHTQRTSGMQAVAIVKALRMSGPASLPLPPPTPFLGIIMNSLYNWSYPARKYSEGSVFPSFTPLLIQWGLGWIFSLLVPTDTISLICS